MPARAGSPLGSRKAPTALRLTTCPQTVTPGLPKARSFRGEPVPSPERAWTARSRRFRTFHASPR